MMRIGVVSLLRRRFSTDCATQGLRKACLIVTPGPGGMPSGCKMHVELVTGEEDEDRTMSMSTDQAVVLGEESDNEANPDTAHGAVSSRVHPSHDTFTFNLEHFNDLPPDALIKGCKVSLEGYTGGVWPLQEYLLRTHECDGSWQECKMRRIDPGSAEKKLQALLQRNPLSHLIPKEERSTFKDSSKSKQRTPDNFKPNLTRFPSAVIIPPSPTFPSPIYGGTPYVRPPGTLIGAMRVDHGHFGQQLLVPKSLIRHSPSSDEKAKSAFSDGSWPASVVAEARGRANPNGDFQVSEIGENGGFFGDDVYFWARVNGSTFLPRPIPLREASASSSSSSSACFSQSSSIDVPKSNNVDSSQEYPRSNKSNDSSSKGVAYFGVLDGVDLWREALVSPRHYSFSHVLGAYALDRLLAHNSSEPHRLKAALEGAVQRTVKKGYKGSCTVLAGAVDLETGILTSVSIGDSVFVVLRRGELYFRLPSQQIGFNCPLQVGHHPQANSVPKEALTCQLQLIPGDIIIAGSDGLWDNLTDEMLQSCLEEAKINEFDATTSRSASTNEEMRRESLALLADKLIENVAQISRNPNAPTPWAVAASKEYEKKIRGGRATILR